MMKAKVFKCAQCGETIEIPFGMPKPGSCPKCKAPAELIHRMNPGSPDLSH